MNSLHLYNHSMGELGNSLSLAGERVFLIERVSRSFSWVRMLARWRSVCLSQWLIMCGCACLKLERGNCMMSSANLPRN